MKKILSKLEKFYIPFDTGKLALFFSVLALAYVASSANTPCLSASTCAVGSDPVFEDNVGIKGGTAFTATLDASLITNDRNIQLPDTDGTLAVTATLAGNKMLRTNVSGEIEVDSATYPVTLSPDLPLYTSATGEVTAGAFDASILGIGAGLSNQVLAVNGGGNALTWATITGVPSLTANKPLISDGLGALTTANLTADKIMVTDTNGNLDTTNVYPLSFSANKPVVTDVAGNLTDITLNANEPVITDGNGNLATSLIDITTDIDASTASANDEIRVGSGGALEYFTPSGGSNIRKVADGTTTAGLSVGEESMCWYGQHTLDKNKRYRLVFDGGVYNIGAVGYYSYWKAIKDDCVTGTGANWDTTGAYDTNGYLAGGSHWTGIMGYTNQSECQGTNNGYANTSSAKTSNIAGKIEFYPWRVESWGGAGLNSNYDMSGIWYDASNNPSGSAGVAGSCLNTQTSNVFSTMTGIVAMFEGNGHTASDRRWALYEIDY